MNYISFRQSLHLLLTVFFLSLGAAMALAQPGGRGMKVQAEGTVVDSKTGEPLVGAAVKVTSADGGTGTFGICDSQGKFTFEVNQPGKYTLEFSYVSYKELVKEVNIWPNRGKLGTFKMKEDPHVLAEVEAIGHSERIKLRGDTLAYNADAYKVQDGASAEELVSKLPGVEVSSDGVKAQGEEVKKILLDGKEFFDNDVKMALRSLPAEALESVNIFDKKSDQAEFTGIDDGETVKAMDLVTKSYRRNGTFGKVFGGLGNNFDFDNGYWNTGFNINVFDGNRRITLQGMSNNVNERNFSTDEMSGGMMGGRQWNASGVARTHGIGINFSNTYLEDKLDVQLSYFFNQNRVTNADTTYRDQFERTIIGEDGLPFVIAPSSSYSASRSLSHSISHNVGGRISYKPSKRDEIMIRPSIRFQSSDSYGFSNTRSWNHPLSDVSIDRVPQSYWDDVLSQNDQISNSESDSWNASARVLWRHRLNKPGRTFSVNFNGGASGSDTESRVMQDMLFSGTLKHYNQLDTKDNSSSNFGGNLQWTEPLATGLNLSFRYEMSYNRSKREKTSDFYNDTDFTQFSERDANNSNIYTQMNLRNNGEIGLSYNYKTLRLNTTVRLQHSRLDGDQDYYLLGENNSRSFSTSKSYFNVLPNIRLEYRTSGGTQFRFNYRSSSNNPSVDNVQKTVDTSNRSRYSTGNPDLDQSVNHNLSFNMIYTNTETAQNFMIFGGMNIAQDQISTQLLTNRSEKESLDFIKLSASDKSKYGFTDDVFGGLQLSSGASVSRPINRNGYKSYFLNAGYGFPFDLIMSNVNISVGGNYGVTPSSQLYYFGEKDKSGAPIIREVESKTRSYGIRPNLHISSNISPDVNFSLFYRPSFQWNDELKDETLSKRNFADHNVNAVLNWTFWNGFTTDQSLNYSYSGGSAQPEAIQQWIWNASLGKKFLKGNKAEVKLQAFDILGSNKGFSRSVGESNITTRYRNFMPRYFLMTFTYKITAYRSNGKQSTRTEEPGFGGPDGGPGGGRGFGGRGGGFGGPF